MNFELIVTFISLTFLQIILMIDNLIFISVLTDTLTTKDKAYARKVGLVMSLFLNTGLVILAGFLTSLHTVLFSVGDHHFTFHNFILFIGGLFLLYKVVKELRCKLDNTCHTTSTKTFKTVTQVIINMVLIDLVFSIDSTIIAIGMTEIKWIQIGSVLVAIVVMYFSFNAINKITDKFPSLKIMALAFLFLIGFSLFSGGLGYEISKGVIYSSMVFALFVEYLMIKSESNSIKIAKILQRSKNDIPKGDDPATDKGDVSAPKK